MNHALTVVEKNEIILKDNKNAFSTRKRKRKKKRRSFRVMLFFAAVIISFALWTNFESIKEYASSLIFPASGDESLGTDATLSPQQPGNDSLKNEIDTESNSCKTVFAGELAFFNESNHTINTSTLEQSFPKANEIYEAFGEYAPVVLLVCSSPTEAYFSANEEEFYSGANNVSDIAHHIASTLTANGISAIALTVSSESNELYTQKHAYVKAVTEALSENPSIAYVFDISRAVLLDDTMTIYKESSALAQCPTVRFTYGTGEGTLTNERITSIAFGNWLSKYANSTDIFVSKETVSKYSLYQDLNAICFRIDIGSVANTYEEACECAENFAKYLAEYIM